MFERILRRCRACIRARDYVVTLHALDELDADDYGVLDLESGILAGTIIEAQRDVATRERKYRIRGAVSDGRRIELVAKFGVGGKLIVITVYEP